ncbi:unnamed protein product [Ceutorhynchus assimilis]|uniref:SWIM-type domain-containing protein n=1 Tax=Ceutorhynchus assimilis TaxID=467358 RepID=A0A9N9MZX3_9CUCU|nr:unnamed protein product [Ceutorhynchus assimilis]
MLQELPKSIVDYFDTNWHESREEWSLSNKYMTRSLLNTTNNRIESMNAKIKQIVNRYSKLEQFVEEFMTFIACQHVEHDRKAAHQFHKTPVILFPDDSPEKQYADFLTAYAYKFILKELRAAQYIDIDSAKDYSRGGIFKIGSPIQSTSASNCTCIRKVSMELPCRHMFAVRTELNMDLFDADLCYKRWQKAYYFKTQRVFLSTENDFEQPVRITESRVYQKKILAQHEKFRNMTAALKPLAQLGSEVSGDRYLLRMKNIVDMQTAWEDNEDVVVLKISQFNELKGSNGDENLVDVDGERNCRSESPDRPDTDDRTDRSDPGDGPDRSDSGEESDTHINSSTPGTSKIVEDYSSDEQTTLISRKRKRFSFLDESSSEVEDNVGAPGPSSLKNILREIKVLPVFKPRGRPKGYKNTVIGLPRKPQVYGPKIFRKKTNVEKCSTILKWLVTDDLAERALLGYHLIDEDEIETMPQEITNAIIDDNVNILITKKYFTPDGWKLVQNIIRSKKSQVWECSQCNIDLERTVDADVENRPPEKISIGCDYCLLWYHLHCVGLEQLPKQKNWMCQRCRKK